MATTAPAKYANAHMETLEEYHEHFSGIRLSCRHIAGHGLSVTPGGHIPQTDSLFVSSCNTLEGPISGQAQERNAAFLSKISDTKLMFSTTSES